MLKMTYFNNDCFNTDVKYSLKWMLMTYFLIMTFLYSSFENYLIGKPIKFLTP